MTATDEALPHAGRCTRILCAGLRIRDVRAISRGVALASIFALGGCDLFEPTAIAKVNGEPVPSQLIVEEAKKLGLPRTQQVVSRLVEEQIDLHVAGALIEPLKLEKDPEFQRKVRMLALSILKARMEKKAPATTVSDAEVKAAYDESPARFSLPEKVRVAVIARPAAANGEKDVTASNCRDQLLAVEDPAQRQQLFAKLASEHSTDRASRYRGGDIGYLVRGTDNGWPEAVVAAAFALHEPGELSSPVTTPEGEYLLRLLHRQPSQRESLEVAARTLRPELMAEKQRRAEAWVRSQLRQQVSLKRYDSAVLGLVETEEASGLATSGPGGPPLTP